ncbi:unnamed protein product [Rotaria sordida]|uniref:Fe2OG dioxygenase domain-containing protein n=1 Tax=Rotaria sordida TaxID=392033 RepID=A0A818TVN5_9BILA|nr:unnamed protein product [Rotaria sordida]CAF0797649.1 unnamed protein product [Rotaria sordida]CAF3692095.1 unnamed protein product [Rotaria sordida]CAF4021475.1 unnamed protein product [Rotaria sordida]
MCSNKRKSYSSTKSNLHLFFGPSTVKKHKQTYDQSLFTYPFIDAYPLPSFILQTNTKECRIINDKLDLDLLYITSFIPSPCDMSLYTFLLNILPWYRVKYSKQTDRLVDIITPRYTTVFGIDDTQQSKEKYNRTPREIPPILNELKQHVEQITNTTYNFVLVNFYINGQDSIAYHSDDEHWLGDQPCIASLSLGAERDFYMKNKLNENLKQNFILNSGDLIIMRGKTQHAWLHSVPKRTSQLSGRINITFRRAYLPEGTNNYYRYNVGDGPMYRYINGKMIKHDSD